MILTPFASGANVTDFSAGSSEVEIVINDSSTYSNLEDGSIDLPRTESITAATMAISSDPALHMSHTRIDSESNARVWNPIFNGLSTDFSNIGTFQIENGSVSTPVSIKADGLVTDFEKDSSGFIDGTFYLASGDPWQHGSLTDGSVLPSNCASGNMCMGTGLYDTDYSDDNTQNGNSQAFREILYSPTLDMRTSPVKDPSVYFDSFHQLMTYTNGAQNPIYRYADCAYVEVRTSNDASFGPGELADTTGWSHIDIDIQNSTGISSFSGYYQVGGQFDNNRIDGRCNGVSNNDYALGGTSIQSLNNPTGWANLKIDLSQIGPKYIQLRFVLEHNAISDSTQFGYSLANTTMQGWYIDNFRFGDKLPSSEWMEIRKIFPSDSNDVNSPNGYGLLNVEAEISQSTSLTLDVIDPVTTLPVIDEYGNTLTGLSGSIIELWDINSSDYPEIWLRFTFDTGPEQLSTPILYGISVGTRLGTDFNGTFEMPNPPVDGVWSPMDPGDVFTYIPTVEDKSFTNPVERSRFSHPIASITPHILDDCAEEPNLLVSVDASTIQMENNTTYTLGSDSGLPSSAFGFAADLFYETPCNVFSVWFDLEFAHYAEQIEIDVAGDGDVEYSFTEPAFDMFGRQTQFITSKDANNVHYGSPRNTLTIGQSGTAEGGEFMLPVGANVLVAEVSFENNQIFSTTDPTEGFNWKLISGLEEVSLGDVENMSEAWTGMYPPEMNLTAAINTLLSSSLTPTAHIDANGNGWKKFRFVIESLNASSGASIDLMGLDIVYDVTHYLGDSNNFAKELSQGVALSDSTDGTASVPITVHASSGGGVTFSGLSVVTSPGYDSSLSIVGNPSGLYPNGEIYEIVSTHQVSQLTGAQFDEAYLLIETKSGVVELTYSDLDGLTEVENSNGLITVQTPGSKDITDGKEVTWRFTVSDSWEDSETVQIFAGLSATNGVQGLPAALLLSPVTGNAIENDAGIRNFSILNGEGIEQDLDAADTNRFVRMLGSVRLESLDIAPNPLGYFTVVEERSINTSGETPVFEWTEIANQSGTIGGDFDWTIDLGPTVAGEQYFRFRMAGYEGGESLCPPAEYRPDEDCAIPFNLTVDQFSPEIEFVKILNGEVSASIESNWRNIVDDTWVIPSNNQQIKVGITDFKDTPSTVELYYWVEYQHDANGDGVADESEYLMVELTSDGEYPTANYTGVYNDLANQEKDPVGRVSLFLKGYDLAGNAIDGGESGIFDDMVTYASMASKAPDVTKVGIVNSAGRPLLNNNHPSYEGEWNETMYAGNQYRLIVEAEDRNGWRDLDYIQVNLTTSRDDLTVYYFPRNETAWTDSPHLTILEDGEDSDGPRLLRMDGDYLINPFTNKFYLDLPFRINWGIVGLQSLASPSVTIADLDGNSKTKVEGSSTELTKWYYSDGIRLDIRTDTVNDEMITPFFSDTTEPLTGDVREGYVSPGDTVAFEGQFAYIDGILDGVYILPEVELTLEITRLAVERSTAGGVKYDPYGAGGADGTRVDGLPTYHTFKGGAFNINITAPYATNEYTYQFKLVNLPDGAIDLTDAFCATSTSYGCGEFTIKVDDNAPTVKSNTWTIRDEAGTILEDSVSTSNFRCIDITLQIEETEALYQGDVSVAWKFFIDPTTNVTWPFFGQIHGIEPLTAPLSLNQVAGGFAASADCVDLWPSIDEELPIQEQINNIEVVFWIVGKDSAGAPVLGGGPTGASDEPVVPIYSDEARFNSLYSFIYEEASFSVREIDLIPGSPEVGESMTLNIEVVNTGSKAGEVNLRIQSVVDGGIPVTEKVVTSSLIPVEGEVDVEITLESFINPTTGMYYLVFDDDSGELLYNGSSSGDRFNVKIASDDDDSGMLLLIIVVLIGLILVMAIVGLVIMRRGSNDMGGEFYEDESETKAYATLPGQYTESAPSDVSPEMAAAMERFPQWSQAEIQGYFDQGWDIDSLQDWLDSQ